MTTLLMYAAFTLLSLTTLALIAYCDRLNKKLDKVITVLALMDARMDSFDENAQEMRAGSESG